MTTNLRHEGPAIDTPRTLFSAASVAAMVVLSCVASRVICTELLRPAKDRSPTPLYGEGLVLPVEPRLEGIEMMSAAAASSDLNDDRLQKYGWINREKQIIHIPIQRAMELAIERGWLRSATPPTAGEPKVTSAPQNSSGSDSAR